MTLNGSLEDLVDGIYEAAVVPDRWPTVLAEMSAAVDGAGGLLFVANAQQMRWTASPDIKGLFVEFIRDGWAAKNPRMSRMAARNHAGFLRDNDCFTPDELDRDPVYSGFWRQRGLGWNAGTMLSGCSGDSMVFSFEKAYAKGPVEPSAIAFLDILRPHLARAALLSARLGLQKAQAMAAVLETLGIPGAVLKSSGVLVAANSLLSSLMPAFIQDRRRGITLSNAKADGLLQEALSRIASSGARSALSSIPVPAADHLPPIILHLIPVRGAAHDIFGQASSLLMITPVDRAAVPVSEVLQGLFDLTPAEARIARGISAAQSVEGLALELGVSRETIRSQLKAVLSKTGLSRQQELVALLAGKALPAGG